MKEWLSGIIWGRPGISGKSFRIWAERPKCQPDAFWAAFRERADKLPRAEPVKGHAPLFGAPLWAAASALLIAAAVFWRFGLAPGGVMGANIEIVEVSSEMDSLMIWEDAEGKGTIVWFVRHDQAKMEGI